MGESLEVASGTESTGYTGLVGPGGRSQKLKSHSTSMRADSPYGCNPPVPRPISVGGRGSQAEPHGSGSSNGICKKITFFVDQEMKDKTHHVCGQPGCADVLTSHTLLVEHLKRKHKTEIETYRCSRCNVYEGSKYAGVRQHCRRYCKGTFEPSQSSPIVGPPLVVPNWGEGPSTAGPVVVGVIQGGRSPDGADESETRNERLERIVEVSHGSVIDNMTSTSTDPEGRVGGRRESVRHEINSPSVLFEQLERLERMDQLERANTRHDSTASEAEIIAVREVYKTTTIMKAEEEESSEEGPPREASPEPPREGSQSAAAPDLPEHPTSYDGGGHCLLCGKTYKPGRFGYPSHMRQRHRKEWNLLKAREMEQNPTKHRLFWDKREYRRLAEALYGVEHQTNYEHLDSFLPQFPGRNRAALQRATCTEDYRRAVADYQRELAERSSEAADDPPVTRGSGGDAFRTNLEVMAEVIEESGKTRLAQTLKDIIEAMRNNTFTQPLLEVFYCEFKKIIPPARSKRPRQKHKGPPRPAGNSGNPTNATPIANPGVVNGTACIRTRTTLRRGQTTAPDVRHRTKVTSGRQQTRKDSQSRYATHQNMWRRSRSTLWKYIRHGWPCESKLNVEDAAKYWKEYFGRPSKEDNEKIRYKPVNENMAGVWAPLTAEEIRESLSAQKGKAVGLDKVDSDQLRRAPQLCLEAFLNVCLWVKSVPGPLNRNRTVLIPKGNGNSLDPADYRPITVGPVVTRILNSILARRLQANINLHFSQRGFIRADGCLENTVLLNWTLKDAVKRNKALWLLSLDVRKAFDSVSHNSIVRALRCHRIPEEVIQYIQRSLLSCRTCINIGDRQSEEFSISSGVKQGDPLSPLLFNLVIDELLLDLHERMPKTIGYPMTGRTQTERITALAFADDVIIFAENETEMKWLIDHCVMFYGNRGMRLNGDKSVLMIRQSSREGQTTAIVGGHTIDIDGRRPRLLQTHEQVFKYLGICFNPSGRVEPNTEGVEELLGKLGAAPLKPEQKLYFLRSMLIPTILHEAVLGKLRARVLEEWDLKIREFIRKSLHLYPWTINGLIHLPLNKGGLGIPSLLHTVPRILLSRIDNLSRSGHPHLPSWVASPRCTKLKGKCIALLTEVVGSQNHCLDSLPRYTRYWLDRTTRTCDGRGAKEFSVISGVGDSWLTSGSKILSGKRFVRAVQLRFNALPCGDNSARHLRGQQSGVEHTVRTSLQMPSYTARCRYRCQAQETVCHITQHCQYDNRAMIHVRHNELLEDIQQQLVKLGHTVFCEVSFYTREGTVRPDMIVRTQNGRLALILDVSCPFNDGKNTLSQVHTWKRNKYSKPDLLEGVREYLQVGSEIEVKVCGLIFGARGGVAPASYMVLHKTLGVTKRKIGLWSELTISRSVRVWEHHQRGQYFHRLTGQPIGRWAANRGRNANVAGPQRTA